MVARLAPVIGLDAPDGRDDMLVDAEAPLCRPRDLVVLAHHGAAVGDALLVDEEAEIVPDQRLKFQLYVPAAGRVAREAKYSNSAKANA